MKLDGKVAIITGAANGIGKASAKAFAQAGAKLILADIDDDAGERLAHELDDTGDRVVYLHSDVTQADQVDALIEATIGRFGAIDILYNNAGGSRNDGPMDRVQIDDFWDTMRFNLFSTWLCCRAALPALITSGQGVVVNTTSMVASVGWPGKAAYTTSKGAIISLTRSMAVEYAGQGVRVNAVAPGMTVTERAAALLAGAGDHGPSPAIKRHVLGLLTPEQIADAALFLASNASSGITGQILTVDSGYMVA